MIGRPVASPCRHELLSIDETLFLNEASVYALPFVLVEGLHSCCRNGLPGGPSVSEIVQAVMAPRLFVETRNCDDKNCVVFVSVKKPSVKLNAVGAMLASERFAPSDVAIVKLPDNPVGWNPALLNVS